MLNLAVVGHVEWVTHTDAPFIPPAGEIVHLTHPLTEPAGGGAVTAAALARMGARVTFFTAAGDDVPLVEWMAELGVRVLAARRGVPHTRALVMRDPTGERTICVIGENLHPTADDPLPWDELAGCDGVYFTGLDPRTLQLARQARVVVVTARRFEALVASGVRVEALVGSGNDRGEQFDLSRLAVPPEHVVVTDGERGGTGYRAVLPPGPVVDSYGAGDTFVAGVLFGLADGRPLEEALALGAEQAAETVTWRGAYPTRPWMASW
ncbi:MAG TPA: PfkB family carbohydrate kinase [Gaiellales bacterium]|nr:PfkB family carbohydrate kinase [Gaiellales bacterium]